MPSPTETPAVQRTQAALQHTEGRTIRAAKYESDGIVFRFTDGSTLEVDIAGSQSKPTLMAHFRETRKGTEA